jgi:hypothetical protein
MTEREIADYASFVIDALAVTNQSFPTGVPSADYVPLRVACFTVVLADMLDRAGA